MYCKLSKIVTLPLIEASINLVVTISSLHGTPIENPCSMKLKKISELRRKKSLLFVLNKDDKNLSLLTIGRSSCNTHFPPMPGSETLSTLSSHHSSMVSTAACYRRGPGLKSQQGREFIKF